MQVGSELESICGKCGQSWHIVIARDGGKIAKVECRDCGARHRYRPVGGTSRPAAKRRTSTAASARGTTGAPVVEADLSRPSRPFRTSDAYEVGDRVVHATFGEGVVQAVRGPTKVEVLFGVGSKTLIHRRNAS